MTRRHTKISRKEFELIKQETLEYFKKCNIVLTEGEIDRIENADSGLNRVKELGLQLMV